MFEIEEAESGEVRLIGRLDSQASIEFEEFLGGIERSTVLDCERLDYISSDGIGKLFATQKRLEPLGEALTLKSVNAHIREVFSIAGFDAFFEIV